MNEAEEFAKDVRSIVVQYRENLITKDMLIAKFRQIFIKYGFTNLNI